MEERKNHMKRLVGGDFLLDMSPIELELSVDGTTKTNITDNEVLGQLTDLKRFIGSPSMVKPIWCKLTNGETDELIVARGTLAVVDVGEFEICIPLDGYKLTISVEFTQMTDADDHLLDDWYIDTNDAKYILISDAQSVASQFPDIDEFPIFEKIVDAQGHKRFIDGDGTPETISGVTPSYCKWSLSGTHLMLVYSAAIVAGTVISGGSIVEFDLPEWVSDKIVPILSNLVSHFNTIFVTEGYATTSILCYADKSANKIKLGINNTTTFADATIFRMQFDLLIDNETPAP